MLTQKVVIFLYSLFLLLSRCDEAFNPSDSRRIYVMIFTRPGHFNVIALLLKDFIKSIVRIVKLPKRDRRAFPIFRI